MVPVLHRCDQTHHYLHEGNTNFRLISNQDHLEFLHIQLMKYSKIHKPCVRVNEYDFARVNENDFVQVNQSLIIMKNVENVNID